MRPPSLDTMAPGGQLPLRSSAQGILAAKDCGPDDGGFHCVPAFNRFFRGWCNANKDLFEVRVVPTVDRRAVADACGPHGGSARRR